MKYIRINNSLVCFVALLGNSYGNGGGGGEFTQPHFFLGKLEQLFKQYLAHIKDLSYNFKLV